MPTVDQAEHLMREGAFQRAKVILSEIISDDPEDLRAICDIGIAYTETGENNKAIRALLHYIRNDISNPYAWEALGCARFRTGDLENAREHLLQSLVLMPENPSSLRNLGILHGMEGRHKEGLELLQQSFRLASDDYRTLYALNYAFRDAGKSEERTKILNRLIELDLPEEIQRDVELSRIRISIGWE
ncbi:MAG: tetratricopeptide repeat protein [Spirochaetaceae bacterium]|nr:tetratricopeptide repeat protein [Spirochaetaceae bacterium]